MKKVLLIDDDKIVHQIIRKHLSELYAFEEAFDGESGITEAYRCQPDIIILDVEMPGINGYETCDKLRQIKSFERTPIIMLSSRSSLRERIIGYESGADDYLIKPCEQEELKAKIDILIAKKEEAAAHAAEVESARQVAMLAMKGNSELGNATLFIEQTYGLKNQAELGEKIVTAMQQLDLSCVVRIETAEAEATFVSTQGDVSPLEVQLMDKLRSTGRFKDFGTRTHINYDLVSLLVKNMPLDDPETYGRYKDLLPTYLAVSDACLKSMKLEQEMHQKMQGVIDATSEINSTMEQLRINLLSGQEETQGVLSALIQQLNDKLPSMGLELDQEEAILSYCDQTSEKVSRLVDFQADMKGAMGHINQAMEAVVSKHRSLLETRHMEQETVVDEAPEEEFQDVTLF